MADVIDASLALYGRAGEGRQETGLTLLARCTSFRPVGLCAIRLQDAVQ